MLQKDLRRATARKGYDYHLLHRKQAEKSAKPRNKAVGENPQRVRAVV